MKRRRILFFQFSRLRLLIRKFAVVLLFLSAFVLMLLNKTETTMIEKTTAVAGEAISPAIDVLLVPARAVSYAYDYVRELRRIRKDNRRLVLENRRLVDLYNRAIALEIENKILSRLLNYQPPPEATFITARVIAKEGDAFSHSLVVYIGEEGHVKKGQVVMGDKGVVGRVEVVGKNYAKVNLITDINSKIPVVIEKNRVRGILTGDNTMQPKMIFIPLVAELKVGDRIVTSGVAGIFPPGLPIGKISELGKNRAVVRPFSSLDRLEYVKIVDYGIIDDGQVSDE